jgi:hypothetical protein
VTSPNAYQGLYINGNANAFNFTVDGVSDMDTGSNYTIHYEPNMDAVQEVRVLTTNFEAEFGRNSGGIITVVTKSGTQEFHGTGWWTHRHEEFNANNFFNNVSGLARTPYRINIAGYSLGGPVYIPKHFNTGKTKYFAGQRGADRDYRPVDEHAIPSKYDTGEPVRSDREGDAELLPDGQLCSGSGEHLLQPG